VHTAAALVLSLAIGVSLGLLGGGGSILTVPILVYVIGLDAKPAIATSLLVVGITSAAALVPHARAGRVSFGTGAVFGAVSMVGAFVGSRAAHFVPSGALLVAFALMMLVTGVAMLRGRGLAAAPASERPWGRIVASGAGIGLLTGVIGAGGGFLIVPALVLLCALPMTNAVATSLFVIAVNSFAGFAGYVGCVPVDLRLAGLMTLAGVIGSVVGAKFAGRVRPESLRRGFAWFVLAMGVLMVARQTSLAVGALAEQRRERLTHRPLHLGRDHARLRRASTERERAPKRVAPRLAARTRGHVRLHARALIGPDVAFEVLREDRQEIRTPRRRHRLGRCQQRSDSIADREASPVQSAFHGVHADLEHGCHLGCGQPLDVAENEDLAVHRLEGSDGFVEGLRDLSLRRRLVRAGGRSCDGLLVFGLERLRVVRGSAALSPLLDAEAARDGEEPGRERCSSSEGANAPGGREKRLLHHVSRVLRIATHAGAEPVDRGGIPLEQRAERPIVACADRFEEGFVRRFHSRQRD